MNIPKTTRRLIPTLLGFALFCCTAAAEDADVESLVKEFTGQAEMSQRTQQELQKAYGRVIATLISAEDFPGFEGPPKHLLEEIIVRAARPGAERERVTLVRAMLAYLAKTNDLNQRVYLLRQLGVAGREESVPAPATLLKDQDPALRHYALRALEMNRSARAGKAIIDALAGAEEPLWRVALINALGRRRDASAVDPLSRLLDSQEAGVAEAAAMALGNVATPKAAKVLDQAREKAGQKLPDSLIRANLLCAHRLLEYGQKAAAGRIYQQVHKAAKTPLLRMAALRGLALTKPADAVPLVIAALKTSDVRTQAQAARLAVKIPGAEATQAFLKAMPELPSSAQAFLLEALAEREERSGRAK